MEIAVVDDSDYVGYGASLVREGEIYMTDVTSMVSSVIAALRMYSRTCSPGGPRYNKISRLNILDHGNSGGFELGTDFVTLATLPTHEPALARLRGRFESDGFVHLQHCEIGQNRALMLELARVFGASIYAGTGSQNPVYRFNTGDYVRARPNGTFGVTGRP